MPDGKITRRQAIGAAAAAPAIMTRRSEPPICAAVRACPPGPMMLMFGPSSAGVMTEAEAVRYLYELGPGWVRINTGQEGHYAFRRDTDE